MARTSDGYAPPGIPARLRRFARERGVLPVVGSSIGWGLGYLGGRLRPGGPRPVDFAYGGERYETFHHPYHYTWLNERAVEVPIALRALERAEGRPVLEVGNVLSHYAPVSHEVIDRYEQAPGVKNIDVLGARAPEGGYALVICISTLEHVGFDEEPSEPGKAVRAARALRELAGPGGRVLATVPIGYNPALDAALAAGTAGFDRVRALVRGPGRRWHETSLDDALGSDYDFLLYQARAVAVCELSA